MKIRQGFVSNSSSSSFVINLPSDLLYKAYQGLSLEERANYKGNLLTPNGVAAEMLEALINHCKNTEDERYSEDRQEVLDRLLESKQADYVYFHSGNYNTEIYQINSNQIVVHTCNNEFEAWDRAIDSIRRKFHAKVETYGDDGLPEEIEDEYDLGFNYDGRDENGEYRYDPDEIELDYSTRFNPVKFQREGKTVLFLEDPDEHEKRYKQSMRERNRDV
jgi:hypothetical protein